MRARAMYPHIKDALAFVTAFTAICLLLMVAACANTSTLSHVSLPSAPTINCSFLDDLPSTVGFRLFIQNQQVATGSLDANPQNSGEIFTGSGTYQGSASVIHVWDKHIADKEEQVAVILTNTQNEQATTYVVTNCAQHSTSAIILSGASPVTFVVNLLLS